MPLHRVISRRSLSNIITFHYSGIPRSTAINHSLFSVMDLVPQSVTIDNDATIRRDTTIARTSRETNRVLPTHRNRADRRREGGETAPKQGKLSRKFMDDIIRGFCGEPPQFHCLIMAGKKIHVSLFAGPASPGNTIRSLADRLYDYIVIS